MTATATQTPGRPPAAAAPRSPDVSFGPRPARRRPRVAIVGGGPKAHRAVDELRRAARGPIDVFVCEPHPFPGAGPVYDPRQPPWLRMNLSAGLLDVSGVGGEAGPLDYRTWAAARGESVGEDDYPSRRDVGRYLNAMFERSVVERSVVERSVVERSLVERSLAERSVAGRGPLRVRVVPHRVDGVRVVGNTFLVTHAGGRLTADAVLLATGHGTNACDGLESLDRPRLPAYPADRLSTVSTGRPADVCGLALTFIDVALSLTEGRGGRFEDDPERPGRLVYRRSGREPSVIRAWSRTGRLMAPKPTAAAGQSLRPTDDTRDRWDAALRVAGAAGCPLTESLTDILCDAASSIRRIADATAAHDTVSAAAARRWLRSADRGQDAVACFRRSLNAADGRTPPDWPVAFGIAWRAIYPTLMTVVSHRDWPPGDAAAFRKLAAELERVAFGPPVRNAHRIDALLHDGLLRIGNRSPQDPSALAIDGRIAPIRPKTDRLFGPLIDDGLLSVCPDFGCLRVTPELTAVGRDGRENEGLAVLSRATEGVILGHDSLSRRQHPQIPAWAARTARRLHTIGSAP